MAKFHLVFDCDNAAFDGAASTEIARILRDLAHDIGGGGLCNETDHASPGASLLVRDINGNSVGSAFITGRKSASPYSRRR